MKIIKKGKLPKYVGKCKICGCVFEASHSEIEMEQMELEQTEYEYVGDIIKYKCHCPCCNVYMEVSKCNEK